MGQKTPETPEIPETPSKDVEIDSTQLLLIVVGAHLRAEVSDRPLAYHLHRRISQWIATHTSDLNIPLMPIVCSDIWYVNQPSLHSRPTISVGEPRVNALSAYYAHKLSPALVKDGKYMIQLDPEFVDLRICLWGSNPKRSSQALELLINKYLDGYLRAAATQVEPEEE